MGNFLEVKTHRGPVMLRIDQIIGIWYPFLHEPEEGDRPEPRDESYRMIVAVKNIDIFNLYFDNFEAAERAYDSIKQAISNG